MSQRGYIVATREWTDANDTVMGSVELRVHYLFTPGSEATRIDPACDDLIEFDFVEREKFENGKMVWRRVDASDDDLDLVEWAGEYLAEHLDHVFDDVSAEADAAEEYRADARADAARYWGDKQ
jgi:hypothetical protein